MKIYFHTEDISFRYKDKEKTREWLKQIISGYDRIPGSLNFIFCSDSYLLDINKNYLNHHHYTDVITFDLAEDERISGDIFISVDKVKENAALWEDSFSRELRRVMVHGVLHLLGYDDSSEAERNIMRVLEDKALSLWMN